MALADKIEKLIDMNGSCCLDGRQGVITLARICRAIGYKDPYMGGQMARGACINDIILFLEDNSGAVEQIIEWIDDQDTPEWNNNIEDEVGPDETDDESEG